MRLDNKVGPSMATSAPEVSPTLGEGSVRPWSDAWRRTRVVRAWQRIGLSGQFVITAAGTLVLLMGIAGLIQNCWIVQNLIRGNVEVAAVFMEGIIAPHIRRMVSEPHLSAAHLAEMETALDRSGINSQSSR